MRRDGFHGLLYEYVAERPRTVAPGAAGGRVIVAHLGSGAPDVRAARGEECREHQGPHGALDGLPIAFGFVLVWAWT